MKNILVISMVFFMWATVSSCHTVAPFDSVIDGPKSKLTISSPQLKNQKGSSELVVYIFEKGKECKFTSARKISLSLENWEKSVFVSANKKLYFRVGFSQGSFSMPPRKRYKDYSFLPKSDYEYIIEHVENPKKFQINFFELSPASSNKRLMKVQSLSC